MYCYLSKKIKKRTSSLYILFNIIQDITGQWNKYSCDISCRVGRVLLRDCLDFLDHTRPTVQSHPFLYRDFLTAGFIGNPRQ